jgi:SAM-dependent methyltransferase
MGQDARNGMERQLRRQSLWLRESWLWLLRTKVLERGALTDAPTARPRALDVGCGPGFVMEELRDLLDVSGVDNDPDMAAMCRARDLDCALGTAEKLPFPDGQFDIVYCTFLLLWVKDPKLVLGEMKRVSRGWVLCLAEPDFGGRIDYPPELGGLRELIEQGMRAEGGDPHIGRKLRSLFSRCRMDAEMGVHPGVWDIGRLGEELEDEWRWLRMTAGHDAPARSLAGLHEAWKKALENGSLFQFNPIFYACARIGP